MSIRKKRRRKSWWKKLGMMDRILFLMGSFLLLFTVTMVVVFIRCGAVPDALIAAVFGVCSVEGGIMGWIKNKKETLLHRLWEKEDRNSSSEGGND